MSQPAPRHERSTRGMLAALIVVVLAVAGYVGVRGLLTDNTATPVQTVDYHGWARSGRDDGKLRVLLPDPMPPGWRATSVTYTTGSDPRWHLGMLTAGGRYVGLEEQWADPMEMVQQYVDADAVRGKPIRIDGRTWHVWRDRSGDYALVNTRPSRIRNHPETVVVVGDAPAGEIQRFVGSLSPR
jgi:hypothetical protein